MTVAMYIAKYLNDDIPQEWYHDPTIRNNSGDTVAMLIAK